MKKIFAIILIISLMFLICACKPKCEHYNKELIMDTATCEVAGIKTYECKDCGETVEEYSQSIGHDFSLLLEDTATCTSVGTKTLRCSRCDKTITEESLKKSHNFNGGPLCIDCGTMSTNFKETTVRSKISFTGRISVKGESGLAGIAYLQFTNGESTAKFDVYSNLKVSFKISIYLYDANNVKLGEYTNGNVSSSGGWFTIRLSRNIVMGEKIYYKIDAKSDYADFMYFYEG